MKKSFGFEIIDELYVNQKIRVLRVRDKTSRTYIMKTLCNQYPDLDEIARLKHEYLISKDINIKGVIDIKDILIEKNHICLIKEDFNGITLQQYISNRKISIHNFLDIAIQLCEIICSLHEIYIIHKDINPSNILINPETLEIRITDFSISTTSQKEHPENIAPGSLEGTPSYMSPEQTGRINRVIDYRSDLYSLGVTLYEILLGELPFFSDDIYEQIYQHISFLPKSPYAINPKIPKTISDIVMKLLEKNSEDRYQSATGLKDDLEKCLKQLTSKGSIDSFQLAKLDKSSQFIVPDKLYGRKNEINQIINCFRNCCTGSTEVILISGYSGVGKTSIIKELKSYIFHARGHYIAGKYNQITNNTPYSALLDAFKTRIKQILTESPDSLKRWKEIFISEIPQNRKVLIDFIPEIELIIGPQESLASLGTIESTNRFNIAFNQFFNALLSIERPLVIFLDDLQWADPASINFICNLLTENINNRLLLIGAYRNNEVDASHPLQNLIDFNSERLTHIYLHPLHKSNIQQIVFETLQRKDTTAIELSDFLYKKTNGNPFYLKQILSVLDQENFFSFNYKKSCWEWNLSDLNFIEVNKHSVIELLASNLQKLPENTLDILKLASCIGNKFSLEYITQLSSYDFKETARYLWPALKENFIIPVDNLLSRVPIDSLDTATSRGSKDIEKKYKNILNFNSVQFSFLHDSVHQAVYSLIPKYSKEKIHLAIARKIIEQPVLNNFEDNIFEIVNHYNLGIASVNSPDEQEKIIQLNIQASKSAKKSNAYETSRNFLISCLKIINTISWEHKYKTLLNFYTELLEIEYLCTNYIKADEISNLVISKAINQLDKIKVYEIRIQYYIAENRMQEAIDCAFPFLQDLGIYIPQETSNLKLIVRLLLTRFKFWNKSVDQLKELQLMSDPYTLGAIRILTRIVPAVFISKPKIFPLVIFEMVDLSLKFGNSSESSFAYASYGVILCGLSININAGYKLGALALELLHELDCHEQTSKIFVVFNAFIRHWKEPLNLIIDSWDKGIQKGLESGDIENACHCAAFCSSHIFLAGTNLESAYNQLLSYHKLAIKYRQKLDSIHIGLWLQITSNLLFCEHYSNTLIGKYFDENKQIPDLIQSNNRLIVFPSFLGKIILAYIHLDYPYAFELSNCAIEYIDSALSLVYEPIFIFFHSLVLCKVISVHSPKRSLIKLLKKNRKKLKYWSIKSPSNYLGKHLLVEAEYFRLSGDKWKAIEFYQSSIDSLEKNNMILEIAIANERFAEFFILNNMLIPAKAVMRSSIYSYISWGALFKVKQLQDFYCEKFEDSVFIESLSKLNSEVITNTQSTSKYQYDYDLSIVLQASQAISEEIVLESLLSKLMHVLLESANSQLGVLVLYRNDEYFVEAVLDQTSQDIYFPQIKLSDYQPHIILPIINYVARTHADIVINNIFDSNFGFFENIKFQDKANKSILCIPILNQSQLIGILYFENNLVNDAYRNDHVEILKLLCSQVAISLKNAYLFDDLQKSKAREQAEREINELKSRFISMTSHEFRTPLTAILGTTELIKHYGQGWDTQKQHSYLDRIQKNVKHMTGLLDDVLVLSKADAGKIEFNPSPIDLITFCSSLAEELQLNTKQGQRIELEVEGDPPSSIADEKILRQILSNLLSNAIKYSPENTIVRFNISFSGGEVTFLVQDQGIGIPEADQQQLFESFHRATNVGQIQGTGLGLAIVKKSVELHRGTMTFESVADQGTTFIVKLPITSESLGIEPDD